MELGHWDRSDEALAATLSVAEMGVHYARTRAVPLRGELLLRRGRPEEARLLLEGELPADELRGWLTQLCPILARVRLALADGQGAQAALERWVDAWRTAGSPAGWEQELAWGIEVYLGVGGQERAGELLRDLSAAAERSAAPLARAALQDARGLVAAHEGRHVEAAAHFRRAAALWCDMEAPYLEAHARRLRAASLLQTGDPSDREEARSELVTAQVTCTTLGAPWELEAIATLAKRHGLVPTPAQPATGQTHGLTRREREVLALIAQGCSNRAIAVRLVITEKTAENHVGNILGKLGLRSRAQAAAYAVAHGLAGTTTR
jgi:DNA-binding CsgD family transcriptional regulator